MNLLNQSVKLIQEENIYAKVERCGRICYKSEDKITVGSAVKFVQRIVNNGHTSVLEHAVLKVTVEDASLIIIPPLPYLKTYKVGHHMVLEGNLRAFRNMPTLHMEVLQSAKGTLQRLLPEVMTSPSENLHPINHAVNVENSTESATLHIITNRAMTHEIVRHRRMSFSQESTRYCNYGGKIFFIDREFTKEDARHVWLQSLMSSASSYTMLLDEGCAPQQARGVLPNDLKAEIMVTATYDDWNHFLSLRMDKRTVDPQMYELAVKIDEVLGR